MNQPTREEFEDLKEEQKQLKEEVRKLKQQTEPMKVTRIELDPGGIQNRLDNHAEILREISTKQDEQEQQLTLIYTDVGHMKADIGVIKTDLGKVKAEVLKIRESQADQRDRIKELKATQDEHTKRFDKIETAMATKGDISRLETIMLQILDRMPKTEGE